MAPEIKTSQDLESHMLSYELPQLKDAISQMSAMFVDYTKTSKEEIKAIRQESKEFRDEVRSEMAEYRKVQIQLAEVMAEYKSNERSLSALWIETKQNKAETQSVKDSINLSCDITSKVMKDYINERVNNIYIRISTVALVAGALVSFIYISDRDQVTYHLRDDAKHTRNK